MLLLMAGGGIGADVISPGPEIAWNDTFYLSQELTAAVEWAPSPHTGLSLWGGIGSLEGFGG